MNNDSKSPPGNSKKMTTNLPLPPVTTGNQNLFAAVDMGTSSFKLTLVRADPSSGRLFTLHRLKKPVLIGLDTTSTSTPPTLSAASLTRSTSALLTFQSYLQSHRLPPSHLRIVATSAVRESSNSSEFVNAINESLGSSCEVETLSGTEEARLTYLGILQFSPLFSSRILAIDMGGGSTGFTVGFEGNVLFAQSLKLGHVTLTQQFSDVGEMRRHIRDVIVASGLVERVREFEIDAVVGSSGTIKAIEKAVCSGYTRRVEESVGVVDEFVEREWKFGREDLRCLVRRLGDESEMGLQGKVRMTEFFKDRARFILAGTVLLDEIFEILGIEEVEVSGYALGEGVITEMLGRVYEGFDLNVNARWRSVVRLASKFSNNKSMKAGAACAVIARDIFEGLRNSNDLCDNGRASDDSLMSLNERDLECLEAASLLHNIGLHTGKKGYHKQSYRIIMNGNHLHGYTTQEIQLLGLLVKHHRKKFPKKEALGDSTEKSLEHKFKNLCAILWLSVKLQQCFPANVQVMELIHSTAGFELVLSEGEGENQSSDMVEQILSKDLNESMKNELEYFRKVFKKNLSITLSASDGHTST